MLNALDTLNALKRRPMRIEVSSGPRPVSARSQTDDGLRVERLLIDQIDSDAFAALPGIAFRLRQAREQSESRLAEERKESDRNLLRERSARDAAVAALADREELLAVFGHDMKSLLSVLSAHAELSESRSPSRPGNLENIHRTVRQMDRLISNLLDRARLRAGRFHVVLDQRDASEIVKEAVDVFRPLAFARSISLEAKLPITELPVRVDPDRIFQVLTNLLSNAIKITPRGGRISVTAARQERRVRIAVRDTGRGMPEADLQRIFNPYCRLGREERHGLGLGLYISKSIVQAHGGRIWAESRPGSGSTFYFTIPGAGGSLLARTDLHKAGAS